LGILFNYIETGSNPIGTLAFSKRNDISIPENEWYPRGYETVDYKRKICLNTYLLGDNVSNTYDDTEVKSRLDTLESINHSKYIEGQYITQTAYNNLTEYEDTLYFITED